MSLNAYHQHQLSGESPRQTEYRLFAQITAGMIEARDKDLRGGPLMDVLHRNRTLWTTLAADCATEGNALPAEVRAGIISLSIYVQKTTSAVMRKKASIDDLIDINRTIMEGLKAQTGQAEPASTHRAAPATAQSQAAGSTSASSSQPDAPSEDDIRAKIPLGGLVG